MGKNRHLEVVRELRVNPRLVSVDIQPNTDDLVPVHRREQIVLVDEASSSYIYNPDLSVFDATKRHGRDQMLRVVSQRTGQANTIRDFEQAFKRIVEGCPGPRPVR